VALIHPDWEGVMTDNKVADSKADVKTDYRGQTAAIVNFCTMGLLVSGYVVTYQGHLDRMVGLVSQVWG
jgi:hypothetical protein